MRYVIYYYSIVDAMLGNDLWGVSASRKFCQTDCKAVFLKGLHGIDLQLNSCDSCFHLYYLGYLNN